jgi:putative DNA primase/helicase
VRNGRRVIVTAAASIERAPVKWLVPRRVPIGNVTVLAGVGGLGKSQWTIRIAGELSRGVYGDCAGTLIATAEDAPETTVVPRLEAVEADLERIRFLTVRNGDDEISDGITIPNDLPDVEAIIRVSDIRLLVVDPLVAHLQTSIDSHKDQSVRRALAPLYRLAASADIAVIALLHLNKTTGLAPLARLSGSGGFGNAARSVLLLDRDPDDGDGHQGRRRILAHIKCNLAPLAPSLVYEIESVLLPATDTAPDVETSRITLIGETDLSAEAILNQGGEEERTAREEAEAFLRDYLADGARHPAAQIYEEAAKLRIADSTLKRARKKIRAKTEKSSFDGGWEWWLPSKSPDTETLSPSTPSSPSENTQGNEENEETTHLTTRLFADDYLDRRERQTRRGTHATNRLAPSKPGFPSTFQPAAREDVGQNGHDNEIERLAELSRYAQAEFSSRDELSKRHER